VEALVPISLFLSMAAVLILRPITRRIGGLLEVMTRDRAAARMDDGNQARMLALMEQMSRRIDMMDERLDFTERLIASPPPRRREQRREIAGAQRS
jgi:hypothetical protein